MYANANDRPHGKQYIQQMVGIAMKVGTRGRNHLDPPNMQSSDNR